MTLSAGVVFGGVSLVREWRCLPHQRVICRDKRWVIDGSVGPEEVELRQWYRLGRVLVLHFDGGRYLVLFPDSLDKSGYSLLLQKLRFS
ncbi:MAG: hypothetical protein R3E73_12880 [Porticoccaceae bacterium]|nr:hypothetical protein [Pseudomonadales bacterium]MCP5171818.1 hypothetical protein [Pseudomonadales bacterium]